MNGNIGSGKRYGFELEAALALDWLGISGAILEGSYVRQWSRVSDPFTGEDVPFSSDLQSSINVEFRHDIAALNLFYGVTYAKNGPRTIREIDEIRSFRFGHFVNAFIEYRFPWFTLRFDGKNIAGEGSRRVRELYTGPRGVSTLDMIRFREQQTGREFKLSVRGRF